MVRMNWHDYLSNQFHYNGTVYPLYKVNFKDRKIRSEVFLLLNMRREGWVTREEVVTFAYDNYDVEDWPDWQMTIIPIVVMQLRNLLPKGLRIASAYKFGYMLTEKD